MGSRHDASRIPAPSIVFLLWTLLLITLPAPVAALEPVGAGHGSWIGAETGGAGLAVTNLDDDPRPDLVFAWIDAPDGPDYVYYKLAMNLDEGASATWGDPIRAYSPGHQSAGLGATVGDINGNGRPDLVTVVIDDPDGENNIRYNIGWDLDESGNASSWKGQVILSEHVGGYTDYAGAGLWDIDRNGAPDLVVAWVDDPPGGNSFYYYILWNLDENGDYESVSDKYEIQTDWHPGRVQGCGVELANLDDDPAPEFVISIVDDPSGDNRNYYKIGWNLREDGRVDSWDGWTGWEYYGGTNQGMGFAVARMDSHIAPDFLQAVVDNPTGENTAYFWARFNPYDDRARGTFQDWRTDLPVALVRHQGVVIAFGLDEDGKTFRYNVMRDDGAWAGSRDLVLPSLSEDTSVTSRHGSDRPFYYLYDSAGRTTRAFRVLSDGLHVYLFRLDASGQILVDRFVHDRATHELKPALDVRYRNSRKRCEYATDPDGEQADTLGYWDKNKNLFYQPTTVLDLFDDTQDFAVVLLETSVPDEQRWVFFSLNRSTGRIDVASLRRAQEDTFAAADPDAGVTFKGLFTDQDRVVRSFDDAGNEQSVTLPGLSTMSFSLQDLGLEGFEEASFARGPAALAYSNQETIDGQVVKTAVRVLLVVPTDRDDRAVAVDFGVANGGGLSDMTDVRAAYADPGADGERPLYTVARELPLPVRDVPWLLESADGFVHLLYRYTNFWSMIYDPLHDRWVAAGTAAADQVKGGPGVWENEYGRKPLRYYPQAVDSSPAGIEYGAMGYDENDNFVGFMKRTYLLVKDGKVYPCPSETVGDVEATYVGDTLIDSTLVGYIEGPPPVPRENLTESDDYSGATSVEMVTASRVSQSYHQAQDWGLDFSSEGKVGWAFWKVAWSMETSYSFLSEKSSASESTSTITNSQELSGSWNAEDGTWHPDNFGLAVVQGRRADVYVLKIKGSDRSLGKRLVPVADSVETRIIPFLINKDYVKNGTLDGRFRYENDPDYPDLGPGDRASYYKKDEYDSLKERIQARKSALEAYYKNYDSDAFAEVPDQEDIARRNILNEYQWVAAGTGFRTETETFATLEGEFVGGSFSFLGMAGVAGGNDDWLGGSEFTVMAGAHVERSFEKEKESESSFELDVSADPEGDNVYDANMCPPPGQEGKVDEYAWATAYLEPETANFDDFYDRVVDPAWLRRDLDAANTLREARNRINKAWRVRHIVTHVSRTYPDSACSAAARLVARADGAPAPDLGTTPEPEDVDTVSDPTSGFSTAAVMLQVALGIRSSWQLVEWAGKILTSLGIDIRNATGREVVDGIDQALERFSDEAEQIAGASLAPSVLDAVLQEIRGYLLDYYGVAKVAARIAAGEGSPEGGSSEEASSGGEGGSGGGACFLKLLDRGL